VLAEGERELRVAAVAALVEIGSAGAMQSLEKALGDGDREIRITAVRAIGGRGQRSALPRVDSIVKSKELRAADMTERMAFFEAYGQLCGDGGVPFLDGLLNGKSGLLGRKEDREIRACAASALGYVKTSRAEESLKKGLDEKDLLVRNAVNRALRRGAA
jgi:HEAT repeat protein